MADPIGLYMINDSDSEELKRQKINSNFNILLSGLTSGLGNGNTGVPMIFGGNGFAGSAHGYYDAVRDRLEVDRLYAEHLESKYMRTDFLNVEKGAHIDGCDFRDGTITCSNVNVAHELVSNIIAAIELGSDKAEFNTINALRINADCISTGTIAFDRLAQRMSDGTLQFVEWMEDENGGSFVPVSGDVSGQFVKDNTLPGSAIVAESITADKITADDIKSFNGLSKINLRYGTFDFKSIKDNVEFMELKWDGDDLSILRQGVETVQLRPNMVVSQTALAQQTVCIRPDDIKTVLGEDPTKPENTAVGWAWIAREEGDFVLKRMSVRGDVVSSSPVVTQDRG